MLDTDIPVALQDANSLIHVTDPASYGTSFVLAALRANEGSACAVTRLLELLVRIFRCK